MAEPPRIEVLEAPACEQAAAAVKSRGAVILRGVASSDLTQRARQAIADCIEADLKRFGPRHPFPGMVHVLAARAPVFLEMLQLSAIRKALRMVLGHGCILHAYNSSSTPPSASNYARDIHVDCPRWIDGYITNVGCVLALDPFTEANGAMEIMLESFQTPAAPSEAMFEELCVSALMEPGDALLFNARSWHRSGINRTNGWRHAVTFNVCRAYMRQQFDFPRLLESAGISITDVELRQFLGWHVRMPTSMEEFLLPPDQRLYRPGQE